MTTDYVIDETLTLMRARGQGSKAIIFGRRVFDLGSEVQVIHVADIDLQRAWKVFRDNPDRNWSFTDCTSKVVMERLHIKAVLTFDQHFREFGGIELIP